MAECAKALRRSPKLLAHCDYARERLVMMFPFNQPSFGCGIYSEGSCTCLGTFISPCIFSLLDALMEQSVALA
jgi:hypothetical protein